MSGLGAILATAPDPAGPDITYVDFDVRLSTMIAALAGFALLTGAVVYVIVRFTRPRRDPPGGPSGGPPPSGP